MNADRFAGFYVACVGDGELVFSVGAGGDARREVTRADVEGLPDDWFDELEGDDGAA